MHTRILLLILIILAFGYGCVGSKTAHSQPNDVYGPSAYRYFLNGDMPMAISTYKRGYAAARRDDNGRAAAHYLSNIGRALYEIELIDSAIIYSTRAHDEFTIFGDSASAASTAAFLAIYNAAAGNGEEARKWLLLASSSPSSNSQKKGGSGEHYLAVIGGMVDYRLSSTINNENPITAALAYYGKKKDHGMLSTIYILKADAELSKGNCAAASSLLDDALSSINKSRERYKGSRVLLKLSAIKRCAGDLRTALHYYERAIDCAPRGLVVPAFDDVEFDCGRLCR